jgi:hypothetical protein
VIELNISPTRWAIMMQESGGNARAERYEPGFRRQYVQGRGFPAHEEEFRSTSWGLWQLMGEVLRELGFRGTAREFCADPLLQLKYFNKQWAKINKRHPIAEAPKWRRVESWNKGIGGAARLDAPTSYADSVARWLDQAPMNDRRRVIVRFG